MKVRIKKLPKGFSVRNGHVMKNKSHGGSNTGDQESFGLVTLPSPYTDDISTFGSFNSPYGDVNTTLKAVPREEANLEAEVGETVLTDMNDDGDFELYNIGGKRHHKGGTPLNLPPQSFIYSDTGSMKLDKFELAEMGIDSKKKLTPAKVSKNYQLNKYISILNDPHSDKIANDTAEYMLQKNKESLSQLAFLQEAKKDFEDGVPLASYPYLYNQGIDPIKFSQKVEGLTKQEAEQKALLQLPMEERMKIMKLKEMLSQANQQQAAPQGPPQGMPPQGPPQAMPSQQMMPPIPPMGAQPMMAEAMPMQPPMAQAPVPAPMMRYGGSLRKFQGDDGSSELSYEMLYNDLLKKMLNEADGQVQNLNNQNTLNGELNTNSELRNNNITLNNEIKPDKNIISQSDQDFVMDVIAWKKHIEAGGPAPTNPNMAYTEAYNQIHGNYEFSPEEEEETTAPTSVINNTYVTNTQDPETMKDIILEQYKANYENYMDGLPEKTNQYPPLGYNPQKGYQLEFSNTDSPYYVGSQFATGDTLETMRRGGSVKKLKRFKKGGQIPANAFPITNKQTGEVIAMNQTELDAMKESNPVLYNRILEAYGETTGTTSDVPGRTSSKETKKTYKGYDSWSNYYESDDAIEYRDKRYQAYKILAEKNNLTPLSADEYHKNYARYMREAEAFTIKAEEDPSFRDNPNWDSAWEWVESDTPCVEGDYNCREYEGKSWRKVSDEKHENSWWYKKQQKELNLTDTEGNVIEPMDEEMALHMQTGMNAGIILQKTGQGDDTYDAPVNFDVYENEDLEQIDPLTGATKADGWRGNNMMFNTEGTFDIVPAEGCTNAAEIKTACEAKGGTFIPWDSVSQTGCTCEVPEKEDIEPIVPGDIPPGVQPYPPEFWLQDKLGYHNALDNKMSLRKYYPWAPKYNANLIDPVFKDPTREIAAIGEQARIAADTASAFSGPQRAAAVQSKAQGKAAQQIADTINKVQSDNITIANTVASKNAEILYKTQVLNNNETKQLYDNTQLVEQNYDNAVRKANTEITKQLQNAYTNMANTYNLNTLYKNFDILPGTGGMVHITNYDQFNKQPGATSSQSISEEYASFKRAMISEAGVDEKDIPTFKEWYETIYKTKQVPNSDAEAVISGGYKSQRGGQTRTARLARKGMELRHFFSGGQF